MPENEPVGGAVIPYGETGKTVRALRCVSEVWQNRFPDRNCSSWRHEMTKRGREAAEPLQLIRSVGGDSSWRRHSASACWMWSEGRALDRSQQNFVCRYWGLVKGLGTRSPIFDNKSSNSLSRGRLDLVVFGRWGGGILRDEPVGKLTPRGGDGLRRARGGVGAEFGGSTNGKFVATALGAQR